MSEKIASAYLKAVKSSPLKVMKVTGSIKKLPVTRALEVLQFSKLKLAPIVRALIYSAMANAENNHNLDVDNLYIKRIDIGRAFALKRFAARGRGKSSRILKTYSNIRVVLAEKEEEKVAKKEIKTGKAEKKAKPEA
jgi:large subunit ribosomal protein L22